MICSIINYLRYSSLYIKMHLNKLSKTQLKLINQLAWASTYLGFTFYIHRLSRKLEAMDALLTALRQLQY